MARKRDPNRDKAKEIYRQHNGNITTREIGAQLGVDERKLSVWKSRDHWDIETVVQQKNKDVVQHKKVAKKIIAAAEENEELTDKEKLFCIFYVQNPNRTAAARKAGYSPNSIRQAAWNIIQREDVQAEIKRLRMMRMVDLLVDADDVVVMHMRIAFADITEYVEFKNHSVNLLDSENVDGSILSEVKKGRDGISIKLADRQASLRFLERYFELNPMDKHKKAFDNARLALEQKKVEGANEDALRRLDDILAGINGVMSRND